MGLEFLTRVRNSSLVAGAAVLLVLCTYAPLKSALAVALGLGWSLANFALLQRLVVAITDPARATRPVVMRAATAAAGMLGLFAAGGVLLVLLPPMAALGGFLIPFGVLTLKAASTLLLGSRAWRWITASPWRAAMVIAAVLIAAWWLVPSRMMEPARAQEEHTSAPAAGHGMTPSPEAGPAGEHGEESGPQKFPNFITVIARANPDAEWAHFLHKWEVQIFAILIAALICLVCAAATRAPKMIPGGLQNVVETLVENLDSFITGILGEHHGRRFVPFLGSLFIYIWVMNLIGLVPFMESPTSNLNTTFALAIVVFVYAQYVGIRGLGLFGWVDHLMGSPRDLTSWLLVPLMLPIHVLGELAKPISLSCRLFGNIFGEDMLLVAFVSLGITTLSFAHLPFGLPLQLPFMFLALLTGTLQALVFTVLSTIYLLLMLPHDAHEHEPGHEAEALSPAH